MYIYVQCSVTADKHLIEQCLEVSLYKSTITKQVIINHSAVAGAQLDRLATRSTRYILEQLDIVPNTYCDRWQKSI